MRKGFPARLLMLQSNHRASKACVIPKTAYDRDCADNPGFAQAMVLDLYLSPVTRSLLLLSLI